LRARVIFTKLREHVEGFRIVGDEGRNFVGFGKKYFSGFANNKRINGYDLCRGRGLCSWNLRSLIFRRAFFFYSEDIAGAWWWELLMQLGSASACEADASMVFGKKC